MAGHALTPNDLLREAFALKQQGIEPAEIARRVTKMATTDGYRVSRGGDDQYPELTFERVHDLDWPNIIEEIEGVGQSQVDAVESLLFRAFLHDLKAEAWPLARDVPTWRGDARGFRAQARRKYRPSMWQKLDLAGLYADALSALPDSLNATVPLPVPQDCLVTLGELLAEP